jgi:N,N'-diacetyllegionaminate synthase
MNAIKVAGHLIGPSHPCFIIAEAGVNHNGSLELAMRLVDAACEVGADAVKFQTWVTEKLVAPDAPMAEYQRQNLGTDQSQFAMLKQLELSYDQFGELKAYAEERAIIFFSTPDEEDSADFLEHIGVPLFKIGSGEITNLSLIRHIAAKGRPVILSTGMSNLGEVEAAIQMFADADNHQLVLLHCVSNYPADPADCNLRAMDTLENAFGYPVGFSDHTLGNDVAVAAVARGACVIEKHLTLDKTLPGPDHSASLEPAEFASMVRSIRTIEGALGSGIKKATAAEMETRKVVQKAIVTRRSLQAGERLAHSDLTLRRTSGGLPPAYLPMFFGLCVRHDLEANTLMTWDLVQ